MPTGYGSGVLPIDSRLLTEFYRIAPDKVRAEAMAFVGRSLKEGSAADLSQVLPRFVQLWEQRFGPAQQEKNLEGYSAELTSFGWWFASGKFNDQWAMEQILAVLNRIEEVDADLFVMERLVETAAGMPEQTVECLRLMIEGAKENWTISGWEDESRKILAAIIQGSNPTAREKAIELVHRLGAKGFLRYRDLLPK